MVWVVMKSVVRNKQIRFLTCVRIFLCIICLNSFANNTRMLFVPDLDHRTFRHEVIKFIRAAAIDHLSLKITQPMKNLDKKWSNHYQKTDWHLHLTVYHHGQIVGHSQVHGKSLADVLKNATEKALHSISAHQLSRSLLEAYRFKVDFEYYPSHHYAFIEYGNEGLELSGNRVVVRTLTQDVLSQQLQRSKAYLLRSIDPQYHGIFKFYNASLDQSERLLRTVYSASTLYTLLKIQAVEENQLKTEGKPSLRGLDPTSDLAKFILSNQILSGANKGAFYYGYDPISHEHVRRLVVGTAAKSIFALLLLHAQNPQESLYLERAKMAGDWLLAGVDEKGMMMPTRTWKNNRWVKSHRQSLLYSGQVLSALSRLYALTHDRRYLIASKRIADHFVMLVNQQGSLLGDEYRPANSISSSWVLMSLIDYAQVDPAPCYQSTLMRVGQTILKRQIVMIDDIDNHGRYLDAMTASGNGWINEVMGTAYSFCLKHRTAHDCQSYYDATLRTSRWLLQNAYTPESMFSIKNPQRALGGFITNFRAETVRTDAVCHAVNSLLMVVSANNMKPFHPLSLPERPLREILPLLRAGF